MPGFDGTGPRGEGPMTGGGFGYCTGSAQPREMPMRPRFGAGGGSGRSAGGRGRGYRNRFFATDIPGRRYAPVPFRQPVQYDKEREKQYLENEKILIEKELQELNKRLEELNKQGE